MKRELNRPGFPRAVQPAFDEALGDAARRGRHLSERGNAALLLLRRCGPRRRDDLAIRQLAGARQDREFDLYRRLLMRFALELRTQENDLDEKAERHIAFVRGADAPMMRVDLAVVPRDVDRAGIHVCFCVGGGTRFRISADFANFSE